MRAPWGRAQADRGRAVARPATTGRAAAAAALAAAAAAALAAALSADPVQRALLAAGAAALLTVAGGPVIASLLRRRAERRALSVVMAVLAQDAAPGLCADESGVVHAANQAARDRLGPCEGATLPDLLGSVMANPGAVVHRVMAALDAPGGAGEDVLTRRGHVRVTARRVPGGLLWRLEDLPDRATPGGLMIGLPNFVVGPSGCVVGMDPILTTIAGAGADRIEDLLETVPVVSGELNALKGRTGSRPVRPVLSEAVDGLRHVLLLPAEAGGDDRVDLDALPVALLRLHVDGRVLHANAQARDLLPATTRDGVHLDTLVEGLGRPVREWVADAAEGRGLGKPEIVRVTEASVDTFLQITLGRTLGGGADGLIAVLSDATELKTLEAQFVQSQKMQAIGQLAGGIAHDFNNLLTAITGHCDLLLLRHRAGGDSYGDLMQITQNANRAAALVGQLLAFSRKQTLQMSQVDLRDTLSDLAHLLNRLVGDRVRLVLEHDPQLAPIRCDKRQLEQVLMNLVVNARDAMPEGGTIAIETRGVVLDAPLSRDRATVPSGDYVLVSVRDEGVGIPPDRLRRIFEPFYTTKRPGEGTGLGLSMAYGIVKQSGGFIFADSAPGEGAVFELYFPATARTRPAEAMAEPVPPAPYAPALVLSGGGPVRSPPDAARQAGARVGAFDEAADAGPPARGADAPAGSDAQTTSTPPGERRSRTVLLCEDEAPIRSFASRALRLRGFDVVEASCAEEALDALSDDALRVDLFVTDVMMPGLDGPTWVREALKRRPNVRTVFISGYSNDALAKGEDRVPNSIFLPKPFSLADFTSTVESVLD